MTVRIAPSLLSADFSQLGVEVTRLDAAGADFMHIDVMDGHFVPNLTIGPLVVKSLRRYTKKPFDVHLMISPIDDMIDPFVDAGADIITIHPEAGAHMHRTVQRIKSRGVKAGVALNPATSLSVLDYMIADIDMILIMTVNPGAGGQSFIPLLEKIASARALIRESGRDIMLEVDGGINAQTAREVAAAGADVLVAGTAVFKDGQDHYETHIKSLRGD